MSVRYVTGAATDALLAVRGGVAVLVADGEGRPAPAADELWLALASDHPVTRVLELLTSAGLAATPSFVILNADEGAARAFVRGPLVVAVEHAGAEQSLDGADVATWRESLVPAFDAIRVGAASGESLALEAGVVRAAAFSLATDATARPAVTSEAPVAVEPAHVESAPVESAHVEPARVEPAHVESAAEQTLTESPLEQPSSQPQPQQQQQPGDPSLFEETIVRSVGEATLIGDHDGLTIAATDIPGFAARERPTPSAAPAAPAPVRYVVETDRGVVEPLLAPVIVGRSPIASQVSSGAVPRLVVIPDNPDLSRTHVRIALEGDTVVVTDLHSRNGTAIQMPGKPRQLLRAGEATPVLDGTIVDLGGTTLTVRSA